MTTDRVREQFIDFGIGYAVGLGALLLWPLRDTAAQDVVLFAGIADPPRHGRGHRHRAIQTAPEAWLAIASVKVRVSRAKLHLIAGSPDIVGTWLSSRGVPAWGLLGYAVVAPIILSGATVTDWPRARDTAVSRIVDRLTLADTD